MALFMRRLKIVQSRGTHLIRDKSPWKCQKDILHKNYCATFFVWNCFHDLFELLLRRTLQSSSSTIGSYGDYFSATSMEINHELNEYPEKFLNPRQGWGDTKPLRTLNELLITYFFSLIQWLLSFLQKLNCMESFTSRLLCFKIQMIYCFIRRYLRRRDRVVGYKNKVF